MRRWLWLIPLLFVTPLTAQQPGDILRAPYRHIRLDSIVGGRYYYCNVVNEASPSTVGRCYYASQTTWNSAKWIAFDSITPPAPLYVLTKTLGDNQTGVVGTTLPANFRVLLTDSAGNAVGGDTVRWAVTSGGGTLNRQFSVSDTFPNSQGWAFARYTLGAVVGTQTVTATHKSGAAVTFTASATASTPPPPPPDTTTDTIPPPPTGTNEPAGMTQYAHATGTTLNFGAGWTWVTKWMDTTHNAIISDASNPAGSGKVIEKRWFAGEPRDNGQGLISLNQFKVNGVIVYPRVMYVRLRVKFSPNYDVTPDYGGMKFGYWGMQGGSNSTYATWINTDGMKPYAFLGGENPTRHHYGPVGYFKVNTWYTLEMIATAQSAKGVADGRYEWWVNGVKIVDAQNQAFVAAGSTLGPNLKGYQLFFIRGKVGGTFRVNDWVRIGELYISGKQ